MTWTGSFVTESGMLKDWTYSPDPALEAACAAARGIFPPAVVRDLSFLKAYLARLGDPQDRLPPVFHVAGTNGKGSVLAFLLAAFSAGGLRAHRFTSPHLVRFEERFVFSSVPAEAEELLLLFDAGLAAAGGLRLSFFEFITGLFFLDASRRPADAVLLETGMGGLHDATNAVPGGTAVITRVSLDHTEVLGGSLEEIALKKAGIMRAGKPCVIAPQEPAAAEVLAAQAERTGALPFRHGHEWRVHESAGGMVYESAALSFRLPRPALAGAHQVVNAGCAIAALEAAGRTELLRQDILESAVTGAVWAGRLQRLSAGPLTELLPPGWELWIDGAHNDSGAEALALQAARWDDGKPLHVILAMKEGKDAEVFCALLVPHVRTALAVDVSALIRAPMMPAPALRAALEAAGIRAAVAEDLESAVAGLAFQYDSPQRILVAGSLYLTGHILRTHR